MSEPKPDPLQRVLQVIPDLRISSLRPGDDGLVNDVLIVNEELVFRFARDEAGRPALEREAQLLAFVRPRVSLPVPEVVQRHQDCIVYRFIPGVPLDRGRLPAQDASTRKALLEQLGTFLHELHNLRGAKLSPAPWMSRREWGDSTTSCIRRSSASCCPR